VHQYRQLYLPRLVEVAVRGLRLTMRNAPKPEPISLSIWIDAKPDCTATRTGSTSATVDTNAGPSSSIPEFNGLREALGHSEIQYGQLQLLHNIGHGSSGVVQKVLHVPSASVLALKVIAVDADEAVLKSILLELKTLHESRHASIVSFYGAFYREGAVHIALEYMDASLLDIGRAEGVAMHFSFYFCALHTDLTCLSNLCTIARVVAFTLSQADRCQSQCLQQSHSLCCRVWRTCTVSFMSSIAISNHPTSSSIQQAT